MIDVEIGKKNRHLLLTTTKWKHRWNSSEKYHDGSVWLVSSRRTRERKQVSYKFLIVRFAWNPWFQAMWSYTMKLVSAIWTDSVIISIFVRSILEKDFRVDGMRRGYVNKLRGHGDKVGLECYIYFFNLSTISDFFIRSGFGKEKWIVFITDAIFSVSLSSCYPPGIYDTT